MYRPRNPAVAYNRDTGCIHQDIADREGKVVAPGRSDWVVVDTAADIGRLPGPGTLPADNTVVVGVGQDTEVAELNYLQGKGAPCRHGNTGCRRNCRHGRQGNRLAA